jgi:hypothetical protein
LLVVFKSAKTFLLLAALSGLLLGIGYLVDDGRAGGWTSPVW